MKSSETSRLIRFFAYELGLYSARVFRAVISNVLSTTGFHEGKVDSR